MSIWEVLGIDKTEDDKAIKKAYAKKLRIYHPEEDPEGFQRLREAYDLALKYAKSKKVTTSVLMDDSGSRQDETQMPAVVGALSGVENAISEVEPDDNLLDFINQLHVLYDNIHSRVNIENWRRLLDSRVVWDIRFQGILSNTLLEFFMEHHYLPTEVWKLLESMFGWREQQEYLYDHYPGDFIDYIFRQLDQPTLLGYGFIRNVDGIDYEKFLGNRENAFNSLKDNEFENAEKFITAALAIYPDDSDLQRLQLEYYQQIGDHHQTLALIDHMIQNNPDNFDYQFYRARLLRDIGELTNSIEACKYIQSHKPDKEVICLMGKCYFDLDELNQAKKMFLQVLKLDSKDIEAKTYLAQINSKSVESLKNNRGKENRKKIKQIKRELGKPNIVQSMINFQKLWIKRTIHYLIIIVWLIGFFGLYGLPWLHDSGLSINELIKEINETQTKYEPITIKTLEDMNKVSMEKNIVQLNLPDAFYIYQFEDNEVKDLEKFDSDIRYVCLGFLKDSIVIMLVDYELAQYVYKNKSIQYEGSVYELNSDMLNSVVNSLKKSYLYDSDTQKLLMVDKYIGPKMEMNTGEKERLFGVILLGIVLLLLSILIVKETIKTYIANKF